MNAKFNLDGVLYEKSLELINDLHFIDSKGEACDFDFFCEDLWLSDSAVIENLTYTAGQWDVELLFALHTNPLKFIKRFIVSYSCKKKATLYASIMRRQAAKDQRGTLSVNLENLKISVN